MLNRERLTWSVMVSCVTIGAALVNAQDADRATANDVELRMYRVDRGNVRDIAETLQAMAFNALIVGSESTSCVIVRASEDIHGQIKALVSQLDAGPPVQDTDVTYLQVKHRDPQEVANMLRQVVNRARTRIAVDSPNQLVIFKAPPAEVDAARSLVERVDHPQRALTLSMYFVQGQIGQGSDGTPSALPSGLRKVAATLAENGFSQLSLLAPMTTSVQESSDFSTGGVLMSDTRNRLYFKVQGEVFQGAAAETARFTILAEISSGRGDAMREVFNVETTLTAKLGDYVVLAAAPSGTGNNEALALIVRAD